MLRDMQMLPPFQKSDFKRTRETEIGKEEQTLLPLKLRRTQKKTSHKETEKEGEHSSEPVLEKRDHHLKKREKTSRRRTTSLEGEGGGEEKGELPFLLGTIGKSAAPNPTDRGGRTKGRRFGK